jgi:hypothetical protein
VSHFAAHRGEAIQQEEIDIFVDLLKQLRDDYLCYIVQEDSALTRIDSRYRRAAELDQDEQFWSLWEPLFLHADSYREGASEKPAAGLERLEFETKRREKSSEIRKEFRKFADQFGAVLKAITELPVPPPTSNGT